MLEELGQDSRFGLRMLRRYPVLSLTVVVTLGLGIGLTSTVFNITNGFVHKPLPFADSGRLMVVDLENRQTGIRNLGVTLADLGDWREHQSSFERLDAFGAQPINLSWERGRSERVPGGLLTSGVLDALRVQPVLGRTFRPEEERPGAAPVIILGYDLWQTRFLRVRDVLGRTIVANGVPRTVVGVMPRGFRFPNTEQAWLPIEVDPLAFKRGEGPRYPVLGRLRDGVSARRARIELAALADRLDREYPQANQGADPTVRTLKQALVPAGLFGLFYMLLAVALGVLLVGCANVANLLLARASAREHVPEGSPLGRRVRLRLEGAPWLTIVGVVRDLKAFPLGLDGVPDDQQRPACIYVPLMQADVGDDGAMALRTLGPPMAITADVRRAVASVDPDAALYRVLSMDGVILRMTWGYPVFGDAVHDVWRGGAPARGGGTLRGHVVCRVAAHPGAGRPHGAGGRGRAPGVVRDEEGVDPDGHRAGIGLAVARSALALCGCCSTTSTR